jgi:arginine/ornithine transport system substrate-binding protein
VDTILRRLFWEEKLLRFVPRRADGPRFACSCSRARVGNMLRSLGEARCRAFWTSAAPSTWAANTVASNTTSTPWMPCSCSRARPAAGLVVRAIRAGRGVRQRGRAQRRQYALAFPFKEPLPCAKHHCPGARRAGAAVAADLRVGLNPAYEPFESKTPTGEIVGFDVDIANALCEQIKRKCVFVESEWDSIIPGLQAKKFDVIVSSMSITPERARVVDFTKRYYKTPSAIVVKKSVKYDGPASLKGMKIGVLKASTQEKWALGEFEPAGVTVVPYQSQNQVYLDIQAGRIDGTVADKVGSTAASCASPRARTSAMSVPTSTT